MLHLRRRFLDHRQEKQAAAAAAAEAPPRDEEVLRELGAFDATEET